MGLGPNCVITGASVKLIEIGSLQFNLTTEWCNVRLATLWFLGWCNSCNHRMTRICGIRRLQRLHEVKRAFNLICDGRHVILSFTCFPVPLWLWKMLRAHEQLDIHTHSYKIIYTYCMVPRETVSFVFPRVLMFPETKSRKTLIRLKGKQNQLVSWGAIH